VTGGYLVPACVIGADVGRVAQLRTGDPVRFELVAPEGALAAWRDAEEALRVVEPVDSDEDPLLWSGAHG
jgi:allophanate hydrolase subunit 2